jgi:Cys-tRNA synthase (O-phospho-L-seryl-tRNA:Cys-tRNA synthase)
MSADDEALVPAVQGSLADIKRMSALCQEAGIPVTLAAPRGKS